MARVKVEAMVKRDLKEALQKRARRYDLTVSRLIERILSEYMSQDWKTPQHARGGVRVELRTDT